MNNSNVLNNINTEDIKFLIELGNKMNNQDNLSTQFPLFVIRDKHRTYIDSNDFEDNTIQERCEDIDSDLLCPNCKKLYNNNKKLSNDCQECDNKSFIFYKEEYQIILDTGMFLTKEAAEKHIKENNYHYKEPYVYCLSVWRSPDIQRLMSILSSIANNNVPKLQYQYS